jgi:hypothetical protein
LKRIVLALLFLTALTAFVHAGSFALFQVSGPTSSGCSLPSGVTLTAIDGETMSSPCVMTNSYYANNGFTYAHTLNWDSPSFFPIGPWLAPLAATSDATRWATLGWNTAFVPNGSSVQSVAVNAGISVIMSVQEGLNWTPGNETVGLETYDEPSTYAQGVSTPISGTANTTQDHRFWWLNNTWNFIAFGGLSGAPAPGTSAAVLYSTVATPNSTTRHIDIGTIDWYPFSGSTSGPVGGGTGPQGATMYNVAGTSDQFRRGFIYGDIIDSQRAFQAGHFPAPICSFIENGGPYNQDTTAASYIQPPELNWAVWQTIIHGTRCIMYFNNSFAGPAVSDDNMNTTYYQTAANYPAGISMYQQTINTDTQVASFASVINSPFATGYVSVSPASGEIQPLPPASSGTAAFAGIDVMAKYSSGAFYIFASTRLSETVTNQSATFTLPSGTTGSVAVCGESRSISISANAFTDTFANAWTVHIYEVNGSC